MSIAAEVGIMPEQFWQITERELMAVIKGYKKRQVEEWKRARLIAYPAYKVNFKDIGLPTEWLPIEGDTTPKSKNTLARIKRLNKIADKYWPALN